MPRRDGSPPAAKRRRREDPGASATLAALAAHAHAGDLAGAAKTLQDASGELNAVLEVMRETKPDKEFGMHPMHAAARRGDVAMLRLLMEAGFDADACGTQGRTPLFVAAEAGRGATVVFLCEAGAEVNYVSSPEEASVVYAAAKTGIADALSVLLLQGADPTRTKTNGMGPLHVACQNGWLQAVQVLCACPAVNVNRACANGTTPLHLATYKQQNGVVEMLLGAGANADATDAGGWTPLHVACQSNDTRLIRLLANAPLCAESPLFEIHDSIAQDVQRWPMPPAMLCRGYELITAQKGLAELEGDEQAVLASALRVNRRKRDHYTPFLVAVRGGDDVNALRLLVSLGANPRLRIPDSVQVEGTLMNGQNWAPDLALADGFTALMLAAKHASAEAAKWLCEALLPEDLVHRSLQHRWTVLHWAAKGGCSAIVRTVLSLADPEEPGRRLFRVDDVANNGMTALYIAAHHGIAEMVELLVDEFGADPCVVIGQHATPLYSACKHGHLRVVKFLMDRGADKAYPHRHGSPLHTASKYDRSTVVAYLVEQKEMNALTLNAGLPNWAPVHSAAQAGSLASLKFFVCRYGARAVLRCISPVVPEPLDNVPATGGDLTPMHLAASSQRADAMRYLLSLVDEEDVDESPLEARSALGRTPEEEAAARGRIDAAHWLAAARNWHKLHRHIEARELKLASALIRSDACTHAMIFDPTPSGDTALSLALGQEDQGAADEALKIARAHVDDEGFARLQAQVEAARKRGFRPLALPVTREMVALVVWAMLPWGHRTHASFPPRVRASVRTMLLVNHRKGARGLPGHVLDSVFEYLGR